MIQVKHESEDKPEKESILDEAKRITDGDRKRDYDEPEDNFQRIADYWNVYDKHKFEKDGNPIDRPKDIAMKMALMKLAREDFRHKRDNLVDLCGYVRCGSKIEGDE